MLRNLLVEMLLDKRNIDPKRTACGNVIIKELLIDGHSH